MAVSVLTIAILEALLSSRAAMAEVTVGFVAPQSGRHAARASQMREAAEKAIAMLNASGGVLGQKVRLTVLDDHCSDAGAVAAAGALISGSAALVVGHPCEKAAVAAARLYGSSATLFMAPASRHPALTEQRAGATVFRLSGREDRQGIAAAEWLASAGGPARRVAIVQDRTAYARAITSATTAALAARGLPPPAIHPIVAGEKSYAALTTALAADGTEAIVFAGYAAEAIIILRELRAAGNHARFLGSDSLLASDFSASAATKDAAVQVLLRPGLEDDGADDATPKPVSAQTPRAAVRRTGNLEDANVAAAITIWAEAVKATGRLDGNAVAAAVQAGTFDVPPLGSIAFDESGDAKVPSFVPGSWNGERWAP